MIDQLKELIIKNNRVDHPPGKHDDMVIAYLLCCFFVMFAKNIRYYGIDANEIIDFDIVNNSGNDGLAIDKETFVQLYRQMADMEIKIKQAASPIIQSKLEMDFRNLQHTMKKINVTEDIVTRTQLTENIVEKNHMTDWRKREVQQKMLAFL